jgi:hypothetical protein
MGRRAPCPAPLTVVWVRVRVRVQKRAPCPAPLTVVAVGLPLCCAAELAAQSEALLLLMLCTPTPAFTSNACMEVGMIVVPSTVVGIGSMCSTES